MEASPIKNLVLPLIAAFFLLAVGMASGSDSVYVSSPDAEVRSAPSPQGRALLKPKKGDEFKVLERWYKVKLPDGAEGWIDGGSVALSRMEERVSAALADIRALLDNYVKQQRQIALKFVNLLEGEIDTGIKFLPERIKLPKAKQGFLQIATLEEKVEFVRKSVFVSIFSDDLAKLDSIKKEIDEKQKSIRPYLRQPLTVSNEDMTIEILPYDKVPVSKP